MIQAGRTTVLCTASVDKKVPPWMAGEGRGWVTGEYSMLPGSTSPRKARERNKVDGRTTEIQRLIGRALRAVVDLDALGERLITVDCDVLEADGGTRTLSITGALIALVDAVQSVKPLLPDPKRYPLRDSVAAVSVGIVDGKPVCDLDYREDVAAAVGRPVQEVAELLRFAEQPTSLDAPIERHPADGSSESLLDSVADDGSSDPMSLTLSNEVERLLEHGLDELNEREREVLAGRYGLRDREPETLEVLAERLGLTRERIRQIQQEALIKLKRRMLRHGIDRDSVF